MTQQPIFIPLSNIESYPIPQKTKEDYDPVKLKGKGGVLRGFRCQQLEAGNYSWRPNISWLGFRQSLTIGFHGSLEDYVGLFRAINNTQVGFIVFVPETDILAPVYSRCKHHPFLILGDCTAMIMLSPGTLPSGQMSFVLEYDRVRVQYPYYDGTVDVTDCTARELVEHICKHNGKEE